MFTIYIIHYKKLIDTEISSDKMMSFLKENESMLDVLADEHLKKINYYKQNS